ncbi:phage antirepressor N-terminal domain-containing protein [Chromobacterium haemolyticum]|uniref:phage antirepressor N-terminal domain-containing protein n=1 Tax=Chromobacterium haemolyticum TaxID=394935 RepID=UPI0009D97D20|nr:phage antirepressor N-terminal domain-containing protein [Chromobacterium haemolyticum]
MQTLSVPFHGNTLYIIQLAGEAYTPMKPIAEGMGLNWASQFTKLKQRFSAGIVEIAIPSLGGQQKSLCLALRKLAGWLYTISPNKVRPELRERIRQYQAECDDVLWEYWTKEREAAGAPALQDDIADEIRHMLPDDAVIFSEGRVQQLYWHAWRSYKVIMQQELDQGINEDTLRLHNTWRSMYPRQIVDGIQRDLMLTCYKGLTDKGVSRR